MSKVDWSKAPPEATHALRHVNGAEAFSRLVDGKHFGIDNPLRYFTMGVLFWRVIEARPATVTQRTAESSAVKTLESLGYVWNGGELWRPPIGKAPSYITDEIDDTVTQRGERYGLFVDGAVIMQDLKGVMRATPGWERLTPSQREALEMIQHKIGRVLNGDPTYDDNWRDVAGYAKLILDELNGVKR